MIPSLIDFLDVVACDTELHFLDRVSRVAANVIFFCFFFSVFFPSFFFLFHRLEQTVDETQWSDRTGERARGGRRGVAAEEERDRPKKKKNADVHDGRVIAGPLSEIIQKSRVSG